MPHKKPQSNPEAPRQQPGGTQQQQGGSSNKTRQQQQESPRDPRDQDQDVQEKAPEGDVETGRGGRSPQVDVDRE